MRTSQRQRRVAFLITRDTYDACMRWSGDATEKAALLRRLRQELPESIEVEKPYEPDA